MEMKYLLFLSILSVVLLDFVQGLQGDGSNARGRWGPWSKFEECTKTCGGGLKKRIREWLPAPNFKQVDNPFTMTQEFTCNSEPCPVDGKWGVWGGWRACTRACGVGTKRRMRYCNDPRPVYGGAKCDGEDWEEEKCNQLPCPPLPAYFNISKCNKEKFFMCKTGKMCIPLEEYCDRTVQCHDGSDENECYKDGKGSITDFKHGSRAGRDVSAISVLVSGLIMNLLTLWLE